MDTGTDNLVVLFDGECNLCDGSVQFIMRNDRKKQFRFAALQSKAGQRLAPNDTQAEGELKSIVLLEGDTLYSESTAALRIARRLGGIWPVLYGFIIVPPFIRNAVYRFISRNRYKWFGKKDVCLMPTGDLRARFINE
jgi:predicted DCC family thiol-disulfide oxidoreductase YuxK